MEAYLITAIGALAAAIAAMGTWFKVHLSKLEARAEKLEQETIECHQQQTAIWRTVAEQRLVIIHAMTGGEPTDPDPFFE